MAPLAAHLNPEADTPKHITESGLVEFNKMRARSVSSRKYKNSINGTSAELAY
jgi:D-serine dehydratase